jgi:hypothetical protein
MKSYLTVAPIICLLASQALADVGHNADFPVLLQVLTWNIFY